MPEEKKKRTWKNAIFGRTLRAYDLMGSVAIIWATAEHPKWVPLYIVLVLPYAWIGALNNED